MVQKTQLFISDGPVTHRVSEIKNIPNITMTPCFVNDATFNYNQRQLLIYKWNTVQVHKEKCVSLLMAKVYTSSLPASNLSSKFPRQK